jgi:hypothetical protein
LPEPATFSIRSDAFIFVDKHLNDRLADVRHQLLKGEISGDEAKRLGREAHEKAFREARDLVQRKARAQGFDDAPLDLFPESRLEAAASEWGRAVDEILRPLKKPEGQPSPC